jgi:hypothetical protein
VEVKSGGAKRSSAKFLRTRLLIHEEGFLAKMLH